MPSPSNQNWRIPEKWQTQSMIACSVHTHIYSVEKEKTKYEKVDFRPSGIFFSFGHALRLLCDAGSSFFRFFLFLKLHESRNKCQVRHIICSRTQDTRAASTWTNVVIMMWTPAEPRLPSAPFTFKAVNLFYLCFSLSTMVQNEKKRPEK